MSVNNRTRNILYEISFIEPESKIISAKDIVHAHAVHRMNIEISNLCSRVFPSTEIMMTLISLLPEATSSIDTEEAHIGLS